MPSIFYGLNIGRSALLAHQTALEVTGHNLANVNTEGYSRQRVVMSPSLAVVTSQGSLGSGVDARGVYRIHEAYLERQISRVSVQQGHDAALTRGLDEIQSVLGEPSEDGLGAALTELWNSFDALAARPGDLALRAQVVDRAEHLAAVYNDKIGGLRSLEDRFDEALVDAIGEVNARLSELADLNGAVAKAEASGYPANDLRDRRDALVRDISEKFGVEVEADGSYLNLKVAGGGPYLVYQNLSYEVRSDPDERGYAAGFRVETAPVALEGGEVGALFELRDGIAPGLRQDLSVWMATITDRINGQHRAGTDRDGRPGRNLFVWSGGSGAVTFAPSTGILAVDAGEGLGPGTHRVEVSVPSDPAEALVTAPRGTGTAAEGISLTAVGSYEGPQTIGLDYHVRVVGVDDPAGTVSVGLYRGDEPVGESRTVDPATGGNVSWDVDGLTFDAEVAPPPPGGAYAVGERSDGLATRGRVSLDGGPAEPLSVVTDGYVTLTGGTASGFLAGGEATVHFSGEPFSGGTFTLYDAAGTLDLDPTVAVDTDRIAAGYDPGGGVPGPGDGENARRIADLATQNLFEQVEETAAGVLGRVVRDLGSQARDARVFEQASASVLLQLDAQRESVSGVNVDEEMVQLLQFQRGYEAAARFMTTIDSMIDTLINRVGLVGR